MVMGLESNVNQSKQVSYDLNVKHVDDEIVSECSICFEPLVNKDDDRTLVKLRCEHLFHLDCIGSAFNAKNKMQCPNCRNVEQGRWLYASGLPSNDSNVQDRILEPHLRLFTGLAIGMEFCPFEAFRQLNPLLHSNMFGLICFSHEPGSDGVQLCPYIEYTITFPQSSTAFGVIGSGDVFPQTNHPQQLIPVSYIPTNPRIFRSALEPGVIRGRYYFTHPFIDPGPIGGFSNLMTNVPAFPHHLNNNLWGSSAVVNAVMVHPYPNGSLMANTLVAPLFVSNNTMPINWVPQSLMAGLHAPVWHGHMLPYGQGQFARGVLDFWSTRQHHMERYLARLAAMDFVETPLSRHMMYGGGGRNSSGSSNDGRGNSNDGRGSIGGGESGNNVNGGGENGDSVDGGSSRSNGNGGSGINGVNGS